MVIVTKNQYLLASKIHHITMSEHIDYLDVRNSSGRIKKNKKLLVQLIYYL